MKLAKVLWIVIAICVLAITITWNEVRSYRLQVAIDKLQARLDALDVPTESVPALPVEQTKFVRGRVR